MTGVQTCALPICFPVTIHGQINVQDGITTGKRLGVNGTIGLLDGEVFASRQVNNSSFAVVKTEGLKGK